MTLKAATGGFVLLLIALPVITGLDKWGVTYTPTKICASTGSAVNIFCSFTYPSTENIEVIKRFWFVLDKNEDLTTEPQYTGRVEYHFHEKECSLTITDLRKTDYGEYRFRFKTQKPSDAYSGAPGVSLSITDLWLQVTRSGAQAELRCKGSCPYANTYVWYKNEEEMDEKTPTYTISFNDKNNYSCAVKGHEEYRSPTVYAPKLISVSVSSSAEIVEGSSVNLTCSSDANPAANYTWYKENQPLLSEEPQLVFSSIKSSDSGEYYCKVENQLGTKRSEFISIDVKYAPKLISLSVSSSAEIVEGSSMNLTCSSDANPAASYTWYKENQPLLSEEPQLVFSSIKSSDSGEYYCEAENQLGEKRSEFISIDVKYAPKLPSVSVSPSAKIVEGSSVTLTCSSDANPAASYTWYKEDEDSPKASGQIFIITDFRAQHSGNYYCEAQNTKGRSNSIFYLIIVAGEWRLIAVATVPALFLAIILISVFLWIIKKRSSKQPSEHGGRPDTREQMQPAEPEDGLHYATVHFSKKQADPVDSNIGPAEPRCEKEEPIVYATVTFNAAASRTRGQEAAEDLATLYSTVNKRRNL